jgi:peptidoglycan/xylan/chitin deacetylase (PgdA/CDA1 family)
MSSYRIMMPGLLRKLHPGHPVWRIPADIPAVYLTFDDGPHPEITGFVLQQLAAFQAKATFFCIGKNVVEYPAIYQQILAAGHAVGNHTHTHRNGWKTETDAYIRDIAEAAKHIDSHIFRPPYGRIRSTQIHMLEQARPPWTVYMWDVLSADFDTTLSPERCLDNVIRHIRPGSIVVFHDSEKAWARMSYALPGVLEYCHQQGWEMKALPS